MLSKVLATNFQSWANLDYAVYKGIQLIDGWNADDQTSEGSGKSSVLNAISWGAFGKLPKDVKIDEVIKDGETHCSVTLQFSNGDSIVRSRKPNDLYIQKSNGNVVKGKDAKETQELIEEYLGTNFETFCQSRYFAQNYDKKFLPANQEEKGKILSSIQNTSIFDKARKEVMELAKKETEKLTTLNNQFQVEQNNIVNYQSQKGLIQNFIANKIKSHEDQVQTLTTARDSFIGLVQVAKTQIKDFEDKISAIDLDQIKSDEEQLNQIKSQQLSQLAEINFKKSQITTIQKSYDSKESEIRILGTKFQAIQSKLQKLQTTENPKIQMISKKIMALQDVASNASRNRLIAKMHKLDDFIKNPSSTCPSCGSELKNIDTSHAQQELQQIAQEVTDLDLSIVSEITQLNAEMEQVNQSSLEDVQKSQQELAEMMSQAEVLSVQLGEIQIPQQDELLEQQTEVDKVVKQIDQALSECRMKVAERTALESKLGLQKQSLHFAETSYSTKDQELSKLGEPDVTQEYAKLGVMDDEISNIEIKTAQLTILIDQTKTYSSQLETLKDGFKEIKSYVFNNALKELNFRSNEYLTQLFEVDATLKFSNEDQKIETTVVLDGQTRGLGLLSGGQNRRFNLAVDLALSDLVSNRKSSKLDVLILDEYFKDLSEVSMDKCLDLLKGRKTPVILIEHNSMFKNIIDNTFFVKLEDGTSYESRPE